MQGLTGNAGPQGRQGPPGPVVSLFFSWSNELVILSLFVKALFLLFFLIAPAFREHQEHQELQGLVGQQGPQENKGFQWVSLAFLDSDSAKAATRY